MSTPDPGPCCRGGGRRGGGGKRGGRGRRPNCGSGQPRAAVTSKQDAILTALLPPSCDKTKADALKITATGSSAAHRVNTALATLAALQREGGSPGAEWAADELKTGRRNRRVPVSETDANPYRIPQSGMVAVGMQD